MIVSQEVATLPHDTVLPHFWGSGVLGGGVEGGRRAGMSPPEDDVLGRLGCGDVDIHCNCPRAFGKYWLAALALPWYSDHQVLRYISVRLKCLSLLGQGFYG